MTNHPGRARDDDSELPGGHESFPPGPPATPRAPHTANGHGAAYEPDIAGLIGASVATAMSRVIPQALASVLSQVPVRTVPYLKCVTCVTARIMWVAGHGPELQAASDAMNAAAAEMPQDHPMRGNLNAAMFLPPHLQPSQDPANPNPQGIGPVNDAMVMAGGSLYCADHIPGIQQGGGRKEFLIAHAPLSSGLIADVMKAV